MEYQNQKTQSNSQKNYAFEEKWSPAIAEHGFTAIPNLLLRHYISLGITTPELRMIIALETFRWDDREPFPGIDSLANLLDVEPRRARAIITSLHNKGIIIRVERIGMTNEYSFEKLIYKLDQLATSSLPSGKKEPPPWDKTRLERRLKTSPEEDAAKQNQKIKPNINTGIEKVGETLSRRYTR